MSKKSPQLRFEGFTDDWEKRKLKDFTIKTGKKNSEGEDHPAYSVSNKLGLVSQTKQFDGSRLDFLDKTAYKFVNQGEFAYNPARINVGSIAFNDLGKTVIVSSLYVVLKISDKLDNEYILQFIKSIKFIEEVKRNTEGSVREYLFFDNFKNIKFPYIKNLEEQQKIGSFFKQLDNTITLHQRKLDLLKEQKKGYLQKMFPKNGAKVPELRFAGFVDDWEQRKLGEMLVNLEAGVSVNSSDYDTGYFILKTSAIKMGNIDLLEVKSIVSEEVARAKTPLIKNSIIISRMNTPELVGASGLVRESIDNIFLPDRLWQGQVAGNFSPEWLIQSINIAANIKKIRDLATGTSGSMKNISKKSMLDLIINVPTLEEQQKIGSFFKQLDDVIALHQRKLDLLKEQKKGFLQKMFV
uniref:Specificity subunit n=1 Tax=Lactococcus lactis subsp. lactis bv. diacetylactis TaxID=44688 RepID=O52274_LACLL|nr:specificity subunit [Lactococcus lactis subsp. lactis bv. diacetylactis]